MPDNVGIQRVNALHDNDVAGLVFKPESGLSVLDSKIERRDVYRLAAAQKLDVLLEKLGIKPLRGFKIEPPFLGEPELLSGKRQEVVIH